MNNKKKYIIFLGLVLIVLIGVSFAFFNQYKVGTTKIGQEAFSTQGAASSETTKLTSVHIPASVTTIESAQIIALNKLVGRITITIDENNPDYTISGGKIVTK